MQAPAQPSLLEVGGSSLLEVGGRLYSMPAPWPVSPGWPRPLWGGRKSSVHTLEGCLLPSTLLPGKLALSASPGPALGPPRQ